MTKEIATNKKAFYSYEILETFEAGIVLQGTEVKSIRADGASLSESYLISSEGELWLKGMHIAPYRFGNIHNHEERRTRKLLLHKKEIAEINRSLTEKGLTAIPLSLYFKEGRVKVKVALVRGKKLHDKRQDVKERDEKRQMQRALKQDR